MNTPRHPNARTTITIRKAIQESTDSLKVLAQRYGLNRKTVAKWKARTKPDDLPSGARSGVRQHVSAEEEEIIVKFREHTLLPLDDCLYALQARIPHLSRSSLHRCFQRHGISRLAEPTESGGIAGTDTAISIGCLQIDMVCLESEDGTHFLFVAVEQASKFAFVQMAARCGNVEAAGFLDELTNSVPFRIREVLTLDAGPFAASHGENPFGRLCQERGIVHRITTRPHPWTRNRMTRMGQVVEDHVFVGSFSKLAGELQAFVHSYNFRRRLKALRGRTPYEFIFHAWRQEPQDFLHEVTQENLGRKFTGPA